MDSSQSSPRVLYSPPASKFKRLQLTIKLHLLKFLTKGFFTFLNLPLIRDSSILPTFTKIYPCQPKLQNRIFVPKSWKSGDALLPLYIDIHGGGFALMSPVGDDKFCSYFANTNKVLVVSLDYPKSPQYKFPAPVGAVVELVNAVLEDEALPFDRKKVAIGGFSAGANLALAVSQHESLQGRIKGIVPYYPPVDFSTPIEVSMAWRPKDAGPDLLEKDSAMFNMGYLKPGQDLKDPLLSVAYASREKLPPKIYLIGCGHDLLCRDAEILAKRLANVGDSDASATASDIWEKNSVRWMNVTGEIHGFDVYPSFGDVKIRREKRRLEMHESVYDWLSREVYT
ncbi:putative alpha/beta hydrolase [Lachnellula suecica]|uniref:Putative alpha/beta hydrolase n=1 Tax=Lachnellula suecica TaxID=602035 RepID=A0A8T9CHF2_9HELO|nr:putative alpha/beta hydrolase [Lachnellula suecica]